MATWSNYSSFDQQGAGLVLGGNYLYAAGGTLQADMKKARRLNLDNGTWSTIATPAATLWVPVLVYANNRVYCFDNGTPQSANANQIYNISANTWSYMPAVPLGPGQAVPGVRNYFRAAYYNNKIYLFGGILQNTGVAARRTNAISIYDITTNSIQNSANTMSVAVANPSIQVQGTKAYIIGGSNNDGNGANVIQTYDFSTGKSEVLTNTLLSCSENFSFLHDGKIYILETGSNKYFQVYSISENKWEYGEQGPSFYAGYTFVYNKNMYVSTYNASPMQIVYQRFGDVIIAPTLSLTNLTPAGGFKDEQQPITFSWTLEASDNSTQRSASFQWQDTSSGTGTTRTIAVNNSTQSLTVAAGTFPNGSFRWRVQVTTTTGYATSWSDWITISTIDPQPGAPENLNPRNTTKDGTKEINLSWRHNSSTNTAQTAYQIQRSYNAASWANLTGKITSSAQYYNIPANTLKPTNTNGVVYWRVMTWNSDNVASPWSEYVSFTVVTAPDPPTWTSVDFATNFPTANWLSPQQTSYELQVLNSAGNIVYESEVQYSRDSTHKITKPIPDGSYTFRVRIYTALRYASAWANYAVTIRTTKPYGIILSTDGEKLTWLVN